MEGNYEKFLSIISKSSGLGKEEVEKRINAKREKISGLISKEGAAQVVAAELGISFDNEKLKIDELLPGMKRVNLVGKVINVFPVRTFTKNGQEGKVANLILADETSNVRVVLWDTKHIDLIGNQIFKESVIEIGNATMRESELHLGSFSDLKISSENLSDVKTERVAKEKNILDLRISDNANLRAFVVQAFEPRFFSVCQDCKKKVLMDGDSFVCDEHGKTQAEKRALMNFVLDDGTETIKAVAFHDILKNLGFANFENPEKMITQKENLLGKEMIFTGNVRMNKYFNAPEFVVGSVSELSVDGLLDDLGK